MSITAILVDVVLSTIIIGPVLWLSGRTLEGKQAKFVDGLWIAALGTLIGILLGSFLPGPKLVAEIVMVIVWLALIKHFFHCGWLKALLTAILAIIIFIVITFILSLIGLTALALLLPHFG
jgi:lysylphosphatidylglycerol synthetase-like protein (DUF2156 family)